MIQNPFLLPVMQWQYFIAVPYLLNFKAVREADVWQISDFWKAQSGVGYKLNIHFKLFVVPENEKDFW